MPPVCIAPTPDARLHVARLVALGAEQGPHPYERPQTLQWEGQRQRAKAFDCTGSERGGTFCGVEALTWILEMSPGGTFIARPSGCLYEFAKPLRRGSGLLSELAGGGSSSSTSLAPLTDSRTRKDEAASNTLSVKRRKVDDMEAGLKEHRAELLQVQHRLKTLMDSKGHAAQTARRGQVKRVDGQVVVASAAVAQGRTHKGQSAKEQETRGRRTAGEENEAAPDREDGCSDDEEEDEDFDAQLKLDGEAEEAPPSGDEEQDHEEQVDSVPVEDLGTEDRKLLHGLNSRKALAAEGSDSDTDHLFGSETREEDALAEDDGEDIAQGVVALGCERRLPGSSRAWKALDSTASSRVKACPDASAWFAPTLAGALTPSTCDAGSELSSPSSDSACSFSSQYEMPPSPPPLSVPGGGEAEAAQRLAAVEDPLRSQANCASETVDGPRTLVPQAPRSMCSSPQEAVTSVCSLQSRVIECIRAKGGRCLLKAVLDAISLKACDRGSPRYRAFINVVIKTTQLSTLEGGAVIVLREEYR
eukprot:TRINITY_DN9148_c0_g1_i3.p1 TRINITY_DN9148_c0_g1~~TRINITY_DN9148_c0_g1_i3.p1  ORF type:complete len:532 (-),score=93.56 TRINITY_DN9148_c0_g1_i3:537-2132(-)